MLNDYSNFGLKIKNRNDLEKLVEHYKDSLTYLASDFGSYKLLSIDNCIELWFPCRNGKIDIDGCEIHYQTDCFTKVSGADWQYLSEDNLSGMMRVWNGTDGELFPLNVSIPNTALVPPTDSEATYDCQIACFAQDLNIYDNIKEYEEAHPDVASQSVIPCGTFSHDNNPDFKQSATAIIAGEVILCCKRQNSYSGAYYHHIRIKSLGMTFDIVADESFVTRPVNIGSIIGGVFWLSAKIKVDE